MSFRDGLPVAGAQVSLLGRNGIPLFAGKTDAQGRVSLPAAEGLKAEKTPAVYLVEKDGDLSFLPFSRDNRLLDVSRFDVDGLRDTADSLLAYLFSDRGIYRPGEEIRAAVIVRNQDWTRKFAGVPLRLEITDPRGTVIRRETFTPGAGGFGEIKQATQLTSPTGTYTRLTFRRMPAIPERVRLTNMAPARLRLNQHTSTHFHTSGGKDK